MDRRTFVGSFAGGLVVWPLAAAAQRPGKVPVVGVLNMATGPRSLTVDSARQGLHDLGYIDGQTILLEVRFAGGKPEAFPALAADLVRRRVDVLLVSSPAAVRARSMLKTTQPWKPSDRGLTFNAVAPGILGRFHIARSQC